MNSTDFWLAQQAAHDAEARAETLAWLRRELGFQGEDIPLGYRGRVTACPIAHAIIDSGRTEPVVTGMSISYTEASGVIRKRYTPDCALTFITGFDKDRYPDLLAYDELPLPEESE